MFEAAGGSGRLRARGAAPLLGEGFRRFAAASVANGSGPNGNWLVAFAGRGTLHVRAIPEKGDFEIPNFGRWREIR
jgi:hypothetical protein